MSLWQYEIWPREQPRLRISALTALLLPSLLRASAARVVSITSTGRHLGRPVDPRNPHLHGTYAAWRAYGQSKLANVHFAVGLQERIRAARAAAMSMVAHPGLSHTELQARSVRETGGLSQRFFYYLASRTGMPPSRAVLPQLRAATDSHARGGSLYTPRLVNFGPPVRRPLLPWTRNQTTIDVLWAVSERETGVVLDVAAALSKVAGN